MEVKKGDRGVLRVSSKGLPLAVNGWNNGNHCIVIEVLRGNCFVVLDLDQVAVNQKTVEVLGYPKGKGFLVIHFLQFEGQQP